MVSVLSMCSFCFLVFGSHTELPYLAMGLTKARCAISLSCLELILTLCLRNRCVQFAFAFMAPMWLSQLSSLWMVMPRYFADVTVVSVWPHHTCHHSHGICELYTKTEWIREWESQTGIWQCATSISRHMDLLSWSIWQMMKQVYADGKNAHQSWLAFQRISSYENLDTLWVGSSDTKPWKSYHPSIAWRREIEKEKCSVMYIKRYWQSNMY